MRKNILLTLGFATIPGCGQMYQGYMKRGISLMFWFGGIIALSALLHIEVLCILLPIIWAYSFFDALNLRSLTPEQHMAMGDFYLPSSDWQQHFKDSKWAQDKNLGKYAGWGLMLFGGLIVYGTFWNAVSAFVWSFSPTLASWMYKIPSLTLAVACIFFGIFVVQKAKSNG